MNPLDGQENMDPLEAVEKLALRARFDVPPEIRVDMSAVFAAARRQRSLLLPLRWSAAISAVAACAVLTTALFWSSSSVRATASSTSDSVDALFAPAHVEIP